MSLNTMIDSKRGLTNFFIVTTIGVLVTLMASCTSIPKESVELSARLDRQLLALESANTALIYKVYADRETAAIEYLDSIWFPEYLKTYFEKQPVQDLWSYALQSDNPADRIGVTSFLTKEAIDRYTEEKNLLIAPIAAERDSIIALHANEYKKARLMNDAIGHLLESQYDVKSAYSRLLPEGKAEHLDSIVQTSLSRLNARLLRIEKDTTK